MLILHKIKLTLVCNECLNTKFQYMSEKYKVRDNDKSYFITLTVVGWIDVFTKKNHKFTIVDSLKYCQKEKGLAIFGWCLMSNHLHLIAKAEKDIVLSDIIRDFKKYTAKKIIQQIIDEPESRRKWMLEYFKKTGESMKRIKNYKFWQDGFHPKEIFSNKFFHEKLSYIHKNPVKELIVENPEDYLFSSARNYAGLDAYINIAET